MGSDPSFNSAKIAVVLVALAGALLVGCGNSPEAGTCAAVFTDHAIDIWTDVDGCAVDIDVVHSQPGDPDCGWELVDEIVIGDAHYHWDPVNLLAYVDQQVRNRTFRTADVIDDLTDTGWRRGTEELWRPLDGDMHVYLVRGDQADRYLLDSRDAIRCTES